MTDRADPDAYSSGYPVIDGLIAELGAALAPMRNPAEVDWDGLVQKIIDDGLIKDDFVLRAAVNAALYWFPRDDPDRNVAGLINAATEPQIREPDAIELVYGMHHNAVRSGRTTLPANDLAWLGDARVFRYVDVLCPNASQNGGTRHTVATVCATEIGPVIVAGSNQQGPGLQAQVVRRANDRKVKDPRWDQRDIAIVLKCDCAVLAWDFPERAAPTILRLIEFAKATQSTCPMVLGDRTWRERWWATYEAQVVRARELTEGTDLH